MYFLFSPALVAIVVIGFITLKDQFGITQPTPEVQESELASDLSPVAE